MGDKKMAVLLIAAYLRENSDEDHPITTIQIEQMLAENGIDITRKTVYGYIKTLQDFGMDVIPCKKPVAGWFLGSREFEIAELKLLVDAVQSSRFITKNKSNELIGKLEALTSKSQAKQLQRQVFVDRRIKTMNESIYYSVDTINEAISKNRGITFHYFDYNVKKEKVLHRDGAQYCVIPKGLIWNSENYYLVAMDENEQIRHYRVDKMMDIKVELPGRKKTEESFEFDMAAYAQKHFGMFGGKEKQVTLLCSNDLVGVVLDRFGQDVMLVPRGDMFSLTLEAVISPQFYGWVFGLGEKVEILRPDEVREDYRKMLRNVLKQY